MLWKLNRGRDILSYSVPSFICSREDPQKTNKRKSRRRWILLYKCLSVFRYTKSLLSDKRSIAFKTSWFEYYTIERLRIWSILLIKSDLKWSIHLSRSLFLYFNYLVSVTAGEPDSPRGRLLLREKGRESAVDFGWFLAFVRVKLIEIIILWVFFYTIPFGFSLFLALFGTPLSKMKVQYQKCAYGPYC